MQNWSGNQQWQPTAVHYPTNEAGIIALVQRAIEAKHTVRLIGSGHSFTPLCATKEVLVSLDNYQGLVSVDQAKHQVVVKAGTKIRRLNQLLHVQGLALENMGDIDVQSIAGAISTGTHGTGVAFGNLCTQVTALRFINGMGKVVSCSRTEEPALFNAAVLSLGTLGIITEITLQCVPQYNLTLHIEQQTLSAVLERYEELNANNRHFEYYWFPNTDTVMTRKVNVEATSPEPDSWQDYLQEKLLENYAFLAACELAYYVPRWTRRISRFSAKTVSEFKKTKASHQVFATERLVRFNEMEYNVPREAYREVKQEIVRWVNRQNTQVMFPMENRFVRGDELYLSPAYKRDSAYIAVHVYHKKDYHRFFSEIEAIFRAYEGRPHWGKLHTRTHEELVSLYPAFGTFAELRQAQDPNGVFLSPYTRQLLGLENTLTNA